MGRTEEQRLYKNGDYRRQSQINGHVEGFGVRTAATLSDMHGLEGIAYGPDPLYKCVCVSVCVTGPLLEFQMH